jgi:ATP-dependent Clp protease ATP-binding subunit ClpA
MPEYITEPDDIRNELTRLISERRKAEKRAFELEESLNRTTAELTNQIGAAKNDAEFLQHQINYLLGTKSTTCSNISSGTLANARSTDITDTCCTTLKSGDSNRPTMERFTDRARKVIAMAKSQSAALNHTYVGTEHLLLAMLREGGGLAAEILSNKGVSRKDVLDSLGDH